MRNKIIIVILALLIIMPLSPAFAVGTNYRYTGQELDPEAGLYYYGQRYYDPNVGRFTQPDPVANYLTNPQKIKQTTGQDLQKFLENPQNLNPYSYVQNNPVRYVDPTGEWWKEFFTGKQSLSGLYGEIGEASMYVNPVMSTVIDHPYISGGVIAISTPLIAAGISSLVGGTSLIASLGLAGRTLPPILISQSQRIFSGSQNLKNKEIVTSALTKLQKVSIDIGKGIDYILKEASKSKSIFTDLRPENYGNINIFLKNPVNSSAELIRVTLDPTLNRIISAGFNRINQVTGWINEGQLINFTK